MIPLEFSRRSETEMRAATTALLSALGRRRSVREFSPDPVPPEIIANALRTAGTAPSGANLQPWHFVAVSDEAVKRRIREAAEAEEREDSRETGDGETLFAAGRGLSRCRSAGAGAREKVARRDRHVEVRMATVTGARLCLDASDSQAR